MSISSRLDGAVSTVLIEASEPVAYLTSQPDPLTVLVDLRNVNAGGLNAKPVADIQAPVTGVAIEGGNAPDGSPVARIRVSLDRAAKHRVRSSRNLIMVEVDREAGASGASGASSAAGAGRASAVSTAPRPITPPPSLAPKAPAAAPRAEVRLAATQLRSIKGGAVTNGYAVTLAGNGPLVATSVEEARDLPTRLLLDFHGVAPGRVASVTNINADGIDRVRVATNSRDPLITRVVIDLARKLPYTIESVGEELRVLFSRAVDATVITPAIVPAAAPANVVASASARDVSAELRRDLAVAASGRVGGPTAPLMTATVTPPAAALQATPAVQNPLQPTVNAQGQRQFTGDPITMDFQAADLRAVLRTFADISGLNIVIDPAIQGTVDVALRDVPWDQALDIILRANKLGYTVDGTIVRIAPFSVLAQEDEDRKKRSDAADAAAAASDRRIVTIPLSYAKAIDLVPIVTKSTLSQFGDVQIDTRTNTLIIRDLADRLSAAAELIKALDRPQPQVEIEARIITLNRSFSKELGISWGTSGRVDPTVGTSTGLAFPNSAVLTGSTGIAAPSNAETPSGLGSALRLAMGSINGAVNLDVALRALERSGKVRIVSSPRVSTQNNVEAEITQGSQIPVQTLSNNTVTVTFIAAALVLRVTPQITAANTIIMRIIVDKSAPNYSQVSDAAPTPSIDKQAASTTVLIPDGDTTVIGGIYNSLESSTNDRTPLLHRVPFLGWLFKNDTARDTQDELLIFITPKILK
jgi:type IV pilus assembly protein PilQ